jgi:enterochelin esterase-like enzyme
MSARAFFAALPAVIARAVLAAAQNDARVHDLTHENAVFGETRNHRVFLPPDYDRAPQKRYPVIYCFHGWGERRLP